MSNAESEGVLDRTLRLLACFNEDEPQQTAVQLAARTGLAPSTLHRLLAVLVGEGLLMRVPGHRYAIGARLWELGELSPLSLRLRTTAQPHMMRLYDRTGETVHLAILDGPPEAATTLYIGRVSGEDATPTISRMGGRSPLYATGVGKALLSAQDDDWLERYFQQPREIETLHTITDEEKLRDELATARRRGYATQREELSLGTFAVASVVGRVDGLPAVALGVASRVEYADEGKLAELVMIAAADLRDDLRGS